MAKRPLNDKEKEILERIGSSESVQRSKAIVDMYESGDKEQIAAYEQSNADRRFRQRASRLTMQQFEKEFAEIDRQKQQLESEKGSLLDALKPGGVTPSEWWDNRKEKKKQIKELESKEGKYRAVYDEKKSREMTDNLPEDVKRLLDEYNSYGDIAKANRNYSVFAPETTAMYGNEAYKATERQKEVAKKLVEKGYKNIGELAEYRKYITESESTDKFTEAMGEITEEHPVASTALNLALMPARIIAGAQGHFSAVNNTTNLGVNPKGSSYALTRANRAKRETIGESLDNGSFSGEVKKFLYETADSALESLAAGMMFGAAGGAMLGLSAMNESVIESLESGANNTQALVNGIAAGAFEGIFESLSLGNLRVLKEVPVKTIKDAIKNIGKSILVNFSEEANTELANLIFDYLYNGGTSQYYEAVTALIGQGYSEKEARNRVILDMAKQVGMAGLGGALMGGTFGSYGSAAGAVNYNSQLKETGRQIVEYDNAEYLVAGAKDVEGNDKLRQLAAEIVFNEKAQQKAELENKIADAKSAVADAEAFRNEKRTEYKKATGQATVDAAKAYKTAKKDVKTKKAELRSLQKEAGKVYSKKDYKNVGRAAELLAEQTDADMQGIVKKAVSERLAKVGESDVSVADAIIKKAKGEKLTGKEQKAYSSSKKALQVYRELTGYIYDAEWARELDKDIDSLYDRRYNPTPSESAKQEASAVRAPEKVSAPKSEEYEQKVEDYKGQLTDALLRDRQDKEELRAAVNLCFEYGRSGGYSPDGAIESVYISDRIAPEQRQHAYEAGVYQGIKDTANVRYKGDAVNVFVEGFRGKDNNARRSYTSSFDVFYSEGMHTEKSFDAVVKANSSLLKFIDRDVAEKAFNVGRKLTQSQSTATAVSRKKPEGKGEYNSKTVDEAEFDVFFEAVAKKLGVNITRVQSLTHNGKKANAYIDLGKGEIVSSASSNNEYQSTIHEVVHYGYAYNSPKMRPVAKAVKEYFIGKHSAKELEKLLHSYGNNYEGSIADREEEFVADCIAGMFSTDEGVNDFLAWLENESGYSASEKKTVLEKLSEWILEIIDAISELIQGGSLNDVVADFAKEETDRLKDIRKMFLEALDEVVDGSAEGETKNTAEGGVKYSNKRLTNGSKKSYNKNSAYDEFTSNGMQWAYNADTKIGDNKEFYNPKSKRFVLIEATKNDVGFIELTSITAKERRKRFEQIRRENNSFYGSVGAFRTDGRGDSINSLLSTNNGISRENGRLLGEKISESNKSGDLERGGQNSQGAQDESIKFSYSANEQQLSDLTEEKKKVDNEIFELRRRFDSLKRTEDYERLETAVVEAKGDDEAFNKAIDEYKAWVDESGMGEITRKLTEAKEKATELNKKINRLEEALHDDFMKSIESFDEEDVSRYVGKAVRKLKTTSRFDLAGYLTTTGSLLDFSDGQGYRVRDHREIKEILDMPDYARYSDSMIAFMNMGNIRLQSYGIDISKMPNSKQIGVLRRFFNSLNGEVTVDFSLPDGHSAGSIEYPENTKVDRILNDIKKYFETGVVPELSDVARFRYSLDWVDFAEEKARERSLASEITELKKMVEELRGKIQHPGVKHIVSKLAVQKVARSLKSGYMSKINLQVLTDELFTFYGYMANENGLSWDNVQIYLESIATKILDESKFKNPDVSEYAKGILRDIRGVKIKLNEKQKNAVAEKYGSYNEFRKRMMGTLVLSEEGTSLDERWQELADDYPNLFDIETVDVNQPLKLVEIVAALRQTYEDSYGMDYDSAKDMLMTEIYEQYFEVPETKYISEEYAVKLAGMKAHYNEQVRELKAEFKRQKDEAYKKARAEYAENLKGIREEQKDGLLKIKARYNLRAQNMANTKIREKKRAVLTRGIKRLDKLLRNPGKGAPSAGVNKYGKEYVHLTNIPEEFRKAVVDYCSIFINHDAGVFSGVVKSDSVTVREKKVEQLRKIYAIMQNSDSYLSQTVAEEMQAKIDTVAEIVAEKRIAELTAEELDTVIEVTDYITASINAQVAVWVEGKKSTVEAEGRKAIEEFKKLGRSRYLGGSAYKAIKGWGVNNYKPIYFFERVGGPLEKLFFAIQNDGQRAYARNINAAAAFMESINKKYNYKKWQDEKELVLETVQGHKLKLTKAQAMHIYATARREALAGKDAMHLMEGGIVFEGEIEADTVKVRDEKTGKKKDKLTGNVFKYKAEDGDAHRIHFDDVTKISEYLTAEQKAFIDECVNYLSVDMAALGNEISMELYGIRRFNEKYYIPYNSAKNFIYRKMGESGNGMLKNKSFTKETVFGANNPLVVGDFLEVITSHIEEMSMYNAMVLPLDYFNRVWNYNYNAVEGDDKKSKQSVKSAMQTAFGREYVAYVEQFLEDVNGGINSDAREKAVDKLMSKFKKTAVLGSASVVIQQPSAVVRAFAEIDPKYFVTTTFAGRKKAWENALKYSSTALLKDIGGFDTVSGQNTVDWLTKTEYEGKDKVLKLFTDSQYRDDVLAWGPGFADKITWAHIWAACEKEVRANNRGLSGETLYEAVGKRFDEVINKTQVYDSVISRSAHMRSKSSMMKTVTAFMSEPTVQANMYASAVHDIRSGNKGKGARKVAAVVASQLFNAALVSIIYAARDDEEDETLAEKYISEVVNNFLGSLNPLSMVPLYKDVVSIMQGFDVKRPDMNVISKFIDAIQKVLSKNTKLSKWDRAKGIIGAVGDIWGIPITNLIRDVEALINVTKNAGGIKDTTGKGIAYAISDDFAPELQKLDWYEPSTKDERLYYAFRDNDEKMYNRLAAQYKSGGAIKNALKGQIEDGYLEGGLTDEEATAQFRRLGYSENEAYYEVRKLKEPVAEDESEDTNAAFKSFSEMQGIQSVADAELEAERKEAEEDGKEFSEKADYTWLRDKLKAGDKDAIKEEINLLKDKGVSESKIAGEVRTWLKENDSDVISQAEQSLKGNYSSYESKVKRIADKYGVDESTVASAIIGAAGSDSDPVEGTVYALGDLHFAIDKGNEQTVRYISSKLYEAKLNIKLDEGEDADDAKSDVKQGIKQSLRSKWKEPYQKAKTGAERARIRSQLWFTGMWDSVYKLDDMLDSWLDEN